MPTHENVNRPVRTSPRNRAATLPRPVVDVDLIDRADDYTWPREAEAGLLEDGLLDDGLIRDDALVEEVSIDGMCGVY